MGALKGWAGLRQGLGGCIEIGGWNLARYDAAEGLEHLGKLDALLQGHMADAGLLFHAELHPGQIARRICGAGEPRRVLHLGGA